MRFTLFLALLAATAVLPLDATAAPAPAAAAPIAPPIQPAPLVKRVREIIASRYVLPEKRPALDSVLAEGLASGRYDTTDPRMFAERVNADLARVGQDRHLDFLYDPAWAAMLAGAQDEADPDPRAYERAARALNHGLTEMRVLPGNVRYLDTNGFSWVEKETPAAIDVAMQFLAGGDAVIIDLRGNGGGSGDAVERIVNYFLPGGTPMYDYWDEGEREPKRIPSPEAAPPAGRMLGKPLYVLIGPDSASAAESLAGVLAGSPGTELEFAL